MTPHRALRLRDLLAPPEPWDPGPSVAVDCYAPEAFAAGEPVVRESTAVGADARPVRTGDVLLAANAHGPLRTWVVGESSGRPQVATSHWQVLRGDDLDPGYLRHVLVSNEVQARIGPCGAPMRRTAPAALPDLELSVPTLDVQKRLGRLLDHADALRGKRARVLGTLPALSQALLAALCGEPSGRAHARVPLGDVLGEAPRRGVDVPCETQGRFRLLRPADLREGRVGSEDARYVSSSDAALARTALCDDDVLLACEAARGEVRCAIARPGAAVWFAHAKLWRLRPDRRHIEAAYLHAWLRSPHGRAAVLHAWTSARRSAGAARLSNLALPLPPLERQRAFAEALGIIDRLDGRLQASGERLDELLGALRDRAFRGEAMLV
jgi:type I restriction enzyme S subunit